MVFRKVGAAFGRQIEMYLCEICQEGQLEMCEYFLENFLEDGCGAVVSCPKFKERKCEGNGDA